MLRDLFLNLGCLIIVGLVEGCKNATRKNILGFSSYLVCDLLRQQMPLMNYVLCSIEHGLLVSSKNLSGFPCICHPGFYYIQAMNFLAFGIQKKKKKERKNERKRAYKIATLGVYKLQIRHDIQYHSPTNYE